MAIVLDGIVLGLQLAALGVGISLVFGLSGVLDLAYGAKIVAASIVGSLALAAGPTWMVAATIGAAMMMFLAVDLTVLAPAHRRHGEARVVLSLLLTLAVAFVIDGVLVSARPHAALTIAVAGPPVELAGVAMRRGSLLAAAVAAAGLAAAFLLLHTTRVGRAIRCVIQDEEGAQLCGIEPRRVRIAVVALSGALAGLVGIARGLASSVGTADGFDLTILAVVVAVVGGLGRVTGAVVAGVILGLAHAIATATLGASATWVILLLAAALTILVRPEGVLGAGGGRWRRVRPREVAT
jgi:branched-chain amino acid transport system permease protein